MATKNYMINDKWLNLDKQNIVELQSVDGVLDSMKVNGSAIVTPSGKITITENGTDIDIAQYALADVNVEGGGGSSDFSTAEVSIVGNDIEISMPVCSYDPESPVGYYLEAPTSRDPVKTPGTYTTVLYKGYQLCYCGNALIGGSITLSGNCEWVNEEDGMLLITGDGTITIS